MNIPKITFFKKMFSSLDNHSLGYSGRKVTAAAAILIGAYITVFLLPTEAQLHALYAWQTVALLCLGIVTIENIITLKNGTTTSKIETSTTSSTSETTTEPTTEKP